MLNVRLLLSVLTKRTLKWYSSSYRFWRSISLAFSPSFCLPFWSGWEKSWSGFSRVPCHLLHLERKTWNVSEMFGTCLAVVKQTVLDRFNTFTSSLRTIEDLPRMPPQGSWVSLHSSQAKALLWWASNDTWAARQTRTALDSESRKKPVWLGLIRPLTGLSEPWGLWGLETQLQHRDRIPEICGDGQWPHRWHFSQPGDGRQSSGHRKRPGLGSLLER